ncbi:hypothetical protein QYE76_036441 [Lolium multiflorum]|uniref:Uncharacterized protein n=1 Tax=Lolium multiflorum TaxID=4521 RepID=A0AAD8VQ57_LOLMU|nr:hypothetical protein QYE76_036441 [Lolium multiflorum]
MEASSYFTDRILLSNTAAIKGNLDPAVTLPLYTAGICWTLVCDTIYTHQEKDDDLKVGVKSMTLRFVSNKCFGALVFWGIVFG